jgi:hypothetical protein
MTARRPWTLAETTWKTVAATPYEVAVLPWGATLDEAGDGRARAWRLAALREGWAWAPRHWTRVTADTGVGDPRAATPMKGAPSLGEVTERIGALLVGLAEADPQDLHRNDAGPDGDRRSDG